jgi:hypothetical protein
LAVDARGLGSGSVKRNLALQSVGLSPILVDDLPEFSKIRFLAEFHPNGSMSRSQAVAKLRSLKYLDEWRLIVERRFSYSRQLAALASSSRNLYLVGYWQSLKYFSETFDELRSEIWKHWSLSEKTTATNELWVKIQMDANPICLNVRRGDFVSNLKSASFHGSMPPSYYRNALRALGVEGQVFVFSDDVAWAQEEFSGDDFIIVGHEHAGIDFSSYLMLMAACKHHVIPNSTFGWWGAMLSMRNGERIAPRNWFVNPSISTKDLLEYPTWRLE